MILLPIGRDESTIQRHAYVSYTIIAMNVLMFIATIAMTTAVRDRGRTAVTTAFTYIVQHPYLTVPRPLADLVPAQIIDRLKASNDRPLPLPSVIHKEQEELDRLGEDAGAAFRKLPNIRYGFIPAEASFSTAISSMFMHGGLLHLVGNMLFFFLSGPFVEDVFGRPLFALLYFAGGFAATFTYWAQHPTSIVPLVGASGAIAAVMGA